MSADPAEALARKMVYGPKGEYDSYEIPGFMVRELLPYARALLQAERVVREYDSHGGKNTHQDCMPGCGCTLPEDIAKLRAALRAVIDP